MPRIPVGAASAAGPTGAAGGRGAMAAPNGVASNGRAGAPTGPKQHPPNPLEALEFHGVQLDTTRGGGQAVGDCPFCGRGGHFYASPTTGQWDCKLCSASGNGASFLQQLWKVSDEATRAEDYGELATDRGLLHPETLIHWGVAKSVIDGEWLVPGYNPQGKICQLYRYTLPTYQSTKRALLAVTGLSHGMFGVPLFDKNKAWVKICEGLWDSMCLWETMGLTKIGRDGFSLEETGSQASSLLSDCNVIGVPSCNTFSDKWCELMAGKGTELLYDNDHHRVHPKTGARIEPAAKLGMKRTVGLLSRAEQPPLQISYLRWGQGSVDSVGCGEYDPSLPHGTDVRDVLRQGPTVSDRIHFLGSLLSKIESVPNEWLVGGSAGGSKDGKPELSCMDCSSWADLVNHWRKAAEWTEGLDTTMSVLLAAILSTGSSGTDQLWIKVVSPPSSGKSMLCEAISVNRKHVRPLSTMRGFFSGYKQGDGSENQSEILKLKGMTLVTKDGDSMVTGPNWPQVMGQARDLYDKTARVSYLNGMGVDCEGINLTWILCGTNENMKQVDVGELGARFLSCHIIDEIDEELEDTINWRAACQARRDTAQRSNCDSSTQLSEEMVTAYRSTGGYIEYIHSNAARLLEQVEMSDEMAKRVIALAKFVSFLRARPSKKQDEATSREMSTRLVKQMVRLAVCLACVLNRGSVDSEVLERVRKVALDTCQGRTLAILEHLHRAGARGLSAGALAVMCGQTEEKKQSMLRFLKQIGVVESFHERTVSGISTTTRWRPTDRLNRLYSEVKEDA